MGRTLFIVEGQEYEPKVLEHLWNNLVPQYANAKVIYTFRAHIYRLYKILHEDPDLSLIGVLKERFPEALPADADEDTFQEVFLVFDYDGHVNMPIDPANAGTHLEGDRILAEMLEYFDDEYEHGRLFLNYPMVESIKHLKDDPTAPEDLVTAKCKGPRCPNTGCPDRAACPPVREYKSLTNSIAPQRADLTKIPWSEWKDIFGHHLAVGHILTTMGTGETIAVGSSEDIFLSQLHNFISQECPKVAVLSAFPLFFHYYLGQSLPFVMRNLSQNV